MLLVAAADLVWANQGLNPTTRAAFYEAQRDDSVQRAFWPEAALDRTMFEQHLRLDDYRMTPGQIAAYRASGLPNLNLLDGADLFNNFDPLLVGLHAAYLELLSTGEDTSSLLRAAGISAVYDAGGQRQAVDDARLAWLAGAACRADDAAAAEAMTGAWNPAELVYLAGAGACEEPAAADGSVRLLTDDLTRFDVNADGEAWLVVAATHYPGWTVTIDGLPAPLERANLAFRAVRVPAGQHSVTFVYAPAWLPPALIVSLAGLTGLAAFFALARRERRYNAE